MVKIKASQEERIYQRHLAQKKKNNASIARTFRCSREWVRLVILKEDTRLAKALAMVKESAENDELDRLALERAEENQNASDSLNGD